MKITLNSLKLGALALATLPTFAFANIGDTYKQSCARYGNPHHRDGNYIDNKDFTITESFQDPGGRADTIYYRKFDAAFGQDQLLTLISFNVPSDERFNEYSNLAAEYGGRFWSTTKGSRTAYLCLRQGIEGGRSPMELSIWSSGKHERVDAAKAAATNAEPPSIDQLPSIFKVSSPPDTFFSKAHETRMDHFHNPDSALVGSLFRIGNP